MPTPNLTEPPPPSPLNPFQLSTNPSLASTRLCFVVRGQGCPASSERVMGHEAGAAAPAIARPTPGHLAPGHGPCPRHGRIDYGAASSPFAPASRPAAPAAAPPPVRCSALLIGAKYACAIASCAVSRSWWSYRSSLETKSTASSGTSAWFSAVTNFCHGFFDYLPISPSKCVSSSRSYVSR